MRIEGNQQQHSNNEQATETMNEQNGEELTSPLLHSIHNTDTSAGTNITIDFKESIKTVFKIYSDQSGSRSNIVNGLSVMFGLGAMTGIVMPKNPDLPHAWYRLLSSIIGYTYFVSWSVSFYPQLITNYQRKTVEGLSTDASILAVLNYTCYTIYNAFLFWDESIRQEYRERNGEDSKITVQSNDVAFSIHALMLNMLLIAQIVRYGGFKNQPVSRITLLIVATVFALSAGYLLCIFSFNWLWIDFLYFMASVKLVLTVLTYLPQLLLNFTRKSTDGWNLWNVIFDCTGGLMSLLQLVLDSVDLSDLHNGLLGNIPKLILSFITLIFDVSFAPRVSIGFNLPCSFVRLTYLVACSF
jgi:cystinosin